MIWIEVIIIAIVQGITEFIPVSSSAHLEIISKIFFKNDLGTSFTSVLQLGTEFALITYFYNDIFLIITYWFQGIKNPEKRNYFYKLGWQIILATLPIAITGILFKNFVKSGMRNLWFTAIMLIVFAGFLIWCEKIKTAHKKLVNSNYRDSLLIGLSQCLALIPGVSRSGITIGTGLLLGYNRQTAVKLSFLIGIPAIVISSVFSIFDLSSTYDNNLSTIQIISGAVIAYLVGLTVISWLLRFISKFSLNYFAYYRIGLGILILGLLFKNIIIV